MEEFDLRRFAKQAYQKKFIILLIIMVCIIAGVFYSYNCVVPAYKSTTTILIAQTSETETETMQNTEESDVADLSLTDTLLEPYISLVTSKKVVRNVISNLDLNLSVESVQGMITVTEENTAMISIAVSSTDAELAVEIANELANVFSQQVDEIFNITNVNVIDAAEQATSPYNVNHAKDILLAVMVGVVISACFVVILYMLDTTIKEENDIEEELKIPSLGVIPSLDKDLEDKQKKTKDNSDSKQPNIRNEELIILGNTKSYVAEAFRTLRTNITFSQNVKSIFITSSDVGNGKSYIAANLATAIAKTDKTVIVIDADIRRGRQDRIFKIDNKYGFSNFLATGEEKIANINEVKKYIKTTRVPNLHLITCGAKASNPSELLKSEKIESLIRLLENIYDYVIIDGTPSNVVADGMVFAKIVSSVVLVVECRKTKLDNAKRVIRSYEQVGGKMSGAVLNKYPVSKQAYSSVYYYEDGSKRKKLKEESTEIKSVEEVFKKSGIHEYLNSNTSKIIDEFENVNIPTIREKVEIADSANVADLERTVYELEKQIVDLKSITVRGIFNSTQMTSNSINELKNSINHIDITNSSEIAQIQKEIKQLKEITSSLTNKGFKK